MEDVVKEYTRQLSESGLISAPLSFTETTGRTVASVQTLESPSETSTPVASQSNQIGVLDGSTKGSFDVLGGPDNGSFDVLGVTDKGLFDVLGTADRGDFDVFGGADRGTFDVLGGPDNGSFDVLGHNLSAISR